MILLLFISFKLIYISVIYKKKNKRYHNVSTVLKRYHNVSTVPKRYHNVSTVPKRYHNVSTVSKSNREKNRRNRQNQYLKYTYGLELWCLTPLSIQF